MTSDSPGRGAREERSAGAAGVQENAHGVQSRLAAGGGECRQRLLGAADARFAARAHHLCAVRRELQLLHPAVVRLSDPLHETGALQPVGDLRHGAHGNIKLLPERRDGARSGLQNGADPELGQRQLHGRVLRIEREQTSH